MTEQIVGVLDTYVGVMHRLVAESPHMAELIEGKESIASVSFATFDLEMKALLARVLHDAGITRDDAGELFLVAAFGTLRIGDRSENAYRTRLAKLVDILIIGLMPYPGQEA